MSMSIDFETACVEFECGTCSGTGVQRMSRTDPDPDWCTGCGGSRVHVVYIGTWLANLAMAAALCRAYQLGWYAGTYRGEGWSPGRGRVAR